MRILLTISRLQSRHSSASTAAARYRCFDRARDLNAMGYVADVCDLENAVNLLPHNYDIAVINKPSTGRLTRQFCRKFSGACQLIADYDDLIFGMDHAENSPHFRYNKRSTSTVYRHFQENLELLKTFSFASVATTPLATEIDSAAPHITHKNVHNGLSDYWLSLVSHARKQKPRLQENGKKYLAYYAGSSGHSDDFNMVQHVLAAFLQRHPNIVLKIVGPLSFDRSIFTPEQLVIKPTVRYDDLPALMSEDWCHIAPLSANRFNQCKSGIKFLESGSLGIPLIATTIPDLTRHPKDCLLLANEPDDWEQLLEAMTVDKQYQALASRAEEWVVNECRSLQQTENFTELFND